MNTRNFTLHVTIEASDVAGLFTVAEAASGKGRKDVDSATALAFMVDVGLHEVTARSLLKLATENPAEFGFMKEA